MIEFEIDNKKLSAEQGKMIIEVADSVGIYIPRFCYHKKLSIAANCRMCLVDVEKSAKPLPACATPITAGMKVFTRSAKAIAAQRAVMEFLLINHPLDCPICDQGGECELQDLAMGYGEGISRYNFTKRSVHDKNLGPLVASFMTRCIQCTRCVRFGEEIAGLRELGAYNRGERLEIGTYVERAMKSELSGNVIDVCPVGALSSKPYLYQARAWEMIQHPSIAPHDCIGSNIYIHTRGEEYSPKRHVMRVVPRANEMINEVWLSDRDRFSYEGLHHEERLLHPLLKRKGEWQIVDWSTALEYVEKHLNKIIQQHQATQIGAIASPSSTLEEFYLLQKLFRGLGSNNIDHRIRQIDFSDQEQAALYPHLDMPIEDIEKADRILLIGSDVRKEQPLGCHRIRKAQLEGAQVMSISPIDYAFNFDLSEKIIVGSELLPLTLSKIIKALDVKDLPQEITKATSQLEISSHEKTIAKKLTQGERTIIFLGPQALNHPQAALLRALTNLIAQHCNAKVGYFTDGANSAGAWLAGAIPHRGPAGKSVKAGLNAFTMFEKPLKVYLLMGIEPELDCANSAAAMDALHNADLVVCLSSFISDTMKEYADVILPMAPFTENAGTLINISGLWQRFNPVGPAFGEARPAWKILRVLGNLFELEGFEYTNVHEVQQEVQLLIDNAEKISAREIEFPNEISAPKDIFRIAEWPIYSIDSMVRRSKPLQESALSERASVRLNAALAEKLNLREGEPVVVAQKNHKITLPLRIDQRIADNNVLIAAGLADTAGFAATFSEIELRSVSLDK